MSRRWQLFSGGGGNNIFRWEEIPDGGSPPLTPSPSSPLPSLSDLLTQGCSMLTENQVDRFETPPTFRTGLGKSVVTKTTSLAKAKSLLGQADRDFVDLGQSGGSNYGGCRGFFLNSMFQTGSGKPVNVSSIGLAKASTLLGLEQDYNHDDYDLQQRLEENRNEPLHMQPLSQLRMTDGTSKSGFKGAPTSTPASIVNSSLLGGLKKATLDVEHSAHRPLAMKFNTAGGKSISVSAAALQRAKSLLGDHNLEIDERDAGDLNEKRICGNTSANKGTGAMTFFPSETNIKKTSKNFVSPVQQSSYENKSSVRLRNIVSGSNLIKKFDEVEHNSICKPYNGIPCPQKPLTDMSSAVLVRGGPSVNGIAPKTNSVRMSLNGPLADISNIISMSRGNKQILGEKRGLASRTVTPFKRPRISKFKTALDSNSTLIPEGVLATVSEGSSCRRTVSTRYPFQTRRKYVKDFVGVLPSCQNLVGHLPDWLIRLSADNAEAHVLCDGSGLKGIRADAFSHMLAKSGCSDVSKEWIGNHYRWIVWKLACYERCYSAKFFGKLLTVPNVLDELKYRYEREVNNGHRSALKRILEGDAAPSSMLVLCISSVRLTPGAETRALSTSLASENCTNGKIELTDGWYPVNCLLDDLLSKQLAAGKLFVGQKLRICGAGLCGWEGPVSPLERAAGTVSLRLHINGTYRAHWADRLGFCKGSTIPLSFRCIKSGGGIVPSTLVGITRIYPVLYRERLVNGGFVVRSERMETQLMQIYNQRCSNVEEGIVSEFQKEDKCFHIIDDQIPDHEGARILKILENSAEPDVLMADMSPEQLTSFVAYQAKLRAMRQSEMQMSVKKALEDAGLSRREVEPLMRVRVVGLTSKTYAHQCCRREGLITIWNPTEKQQSELMEGQTYAVADLAPVHSDSNTVYLYARGSTTKWRPLSPSTSENFLPFFSPRKQVPLSNICNVPISSEFDIAAFVIYVGEVHESGHQKKQWVFVTDGSTSKSLREESSCALLAISFCSPSIDCDSIVPISHNLVGSVVGFCNLIKRAKDQKNAMWVAETTENSTYFINYDNARFRHLREAASAAQKWANNSTWKIGMLREKILSIVARK